jgi:hypothetical protein
LDGFSETSSPFSYASSSSRSNASFGFISCCLPPDKGLGDYKITVFVGAIPAGRPVGICNNVDYCTEGEPSASPLHGKSEFSTSLISGRLPARYDRFQKVILGFLDKRHKVDIPMERDHENSLIGTPRLVGMSHNIEKTIPLQGKHNLLE